MKKLIDKLFDKITDVLNKIGKIILNWVNKL